MLHVLCAALSPQIPLIFGSQLCWCADDVDWDISEISCFCLSPCHHWDFKCICVEMCCQNRRECISLSGAEGPQMAGEVLWLTGSQSWQVLQPVASVAESCTHVISQRDLGGLGELQICSIRLWNWRASRTLHSLCAVMLQSLTSHRSPEKQLVLFKCSVMNVSDRFALVFVTGHVVLQGSRGFALLLHSYVPEGLYLSDHLQALAEDFISWFPS